MIKKYILTLTFYLFSLSSFPLSAQQINHVRAFGSNGTNQVGDIKFDRDGNCFFTWQSDDTLYVNADTFPYEGGLYLAKVDANLQFNWIKPIGVTPSAALNSYTHIAINSANKIWMANSFSDTTFNDTAFLTTPIAKLYLTRHDNIGNRELVKEIGKNIYPSHIIVDKDDNIYVGGTAGRTLWSQPAIIGNDTVTMTGPADGLVMKFDPQGNLLWYRVVGGGVSNSVGNLDYINQVDVDYAGNVYVVGQARTEFFIDTVFFDTYNSVFTQDRGFVAKFSSTGQPLWVRQNGSDCQQIVVDSAGNSYTAGRGGGYYGTTPAVIGGSSKFFLNKFDTDGNLTWSVTDMANMGFSSAIYDMEFGEDHNLYLGGLFLDSIKLNGILYTNLACGDPNNHDFVMAIDTSGQVQWMEKGCGTQSRTWAVAQQDCDVYLAGMFNERGSLYTFGNDTFPTANTGSANYTIFMATINLDTLCTPSVVFDTVWPGDVNADGVVTSADLLYLGVAYNTTGDPRLNASNSWTGQECQSWASSFPFGVNHNHADCDGDGILTLADTVAINLNYGLTHLKTDTNERGGNPPLYLALVNNPVPVGGIAEFDVVLGNNAIPAAGLHGLAFTVLFDNSLLDAGSMNFQPLNSWFGAAGTDLVTSQKLITGSSQFDVAITRLDQQGQGGHGAIGKLYVAIPSFGILKDTIQITEELVLDLINITALDAVGSLLQISPESDTITLTRDSVTVLINNIDITSPVTIAPNPTTGQVSVYTNQPGTLRLYNVVGQLILEKPLERTHTTIDLGNLENGIYIYRLEEWTGKIQLLK